MLGPMKRFWIATVLIAALATALAGAAEAKRHRPTDAPGTVVSQLAPNPIQVFNDYVAPPRAHASARAVVHYVAVGIDAPPLNDDDADGVPDYVERVGDAADSAIAYFERRGFARILADAGGPDARPDIYISRFAAGYFGVAFPAASASAGAFVAIANGLDPSQTRSLGSLAGTVAHELFHLVQFSYFRTTADPDLPGWALEGMAAAMEICVYPELEDIVSSLQLRRWFEAPQRSITAQSYGSQLLWRFLDERWPRIAPAYLRRAAATRGGGRARALSATYAGVTGQPFAPVFGRFAVWAWERYGDRLKPTSMPGLGTRQRHTVAPLGIDYVRVPRAARTVSVEFTGGRAAVTLAHELASEEPGQPPLIRRLPARERAGGLTFRIATRLAARGNFAAPTLIVANGSTVRAVHYQLSVA